MNCSNTCNTRAWRARQPQSTTPPEVEGPLPAALAEVPATAPLGEVTPVAPVAPVALAFTAANVGTLAVGTAMGNLLSAGVQQLFAAAARSSSAAATFPTWPPAELLAAAQSPQWVSDPAWQGQLWLTPITYHGHPLHLYTEAGLPYVLWQAPHGEWRLLTTPAELAQLAAVRPLRAAHRTYGLVQAGTLIGLPLPSAAAAAGPPLVG